jgi:6-pyruvoyltetrahydropterin/6-carboxytetrahydropterin synthase
MGKILVAREFKFSAAHKLTKYKGKCENLHGHTYKLTVVVEGVRKEDGLVIDFVELKKIVNENIIEKLDHAYLNDFFDNPTAENIVVWIWETLIGEFKDGVILNKIKLNEGESTWVEYMG